MEASSHAVGERKTGLVHLVVDDRECRSPVFDCLSRLPQVRLEVRRLVIGDYEVETEWTFERKTLLDFAASLADGRLFLQAGRLARCANGRAIVLEGPDSLCLETGISHEAWQGALISLGLAFHLPVLRSADPEETAHLLIYAGQQINRRRDEIFIPARRPARSLERQRIQMLAALPGVGGHRARCLLEHFGSIEQVVRATERELIQVHGVGRQTAARIRVVVAAGPGGAGAREGEARG